ncbi:MAG TPA: hypothetical protein VK445_03560 [Dissulfurispiraceae bacterium]|nr:hypothetical protein [Dissulfurispiraceae bacterium]
MTLHLHHLATTGIGSVPFSDPTTACAHILETFDVPFWPQLAQRSYREGMIAQYAEGMPYLRFDDQKERIWIEQDDSDRLTPFYEASADSSAFPISKQAAAGLHAFIRIAAGRRLPVVKGHVTGPLTFTLGLKDVEGKPVFFDEEMREIASMLLQAKVRWQIDLLKQIAEDVILFLDEPIFSAIGSSSYLGVEDSEVERLLTDCVAAAQQAGAAAGVHCCGKSDWALVMRTGADILSFDAFEYFETLALYPAELRDFIGRGGLLAWGIVPTSDLIRDVDEQAIVGDLREKLAHLAGLVGSDVLHHRGFITPSCGTGSRTVEETEKIFRILRAAGIAMKESAL